jgi:predicted nucleotidyltransferase
LRETLRRFGKGSRQRLAVAQRLERVYRIALGTGHVARFVVFGSFVTAKSDPADVDVFLLMDDDFDAGQVTGEARLLLDHAAAQAHFGASVFWLRRLAALGSEDETIDGWQIKRDGSHRGIVEIIEDIGAGCG